MPSYFQFQPYRSDAPRTVADIMLRSGDQQAAALRASGEAKARGIASIGADAAGTIGAIQQERRDAPVRALQLQNLKNETALGDAKVAAVRRAKIGQDVLATAVQRFGDDPEKVVKFVTANGFGELGDGYMQTQDLLSKLRKGAIADQDSANAFEGEILSRIAKLPTPEAKQAAWTAAQGALKAHKVDTSSLSPTWDDAQAAQQIALYGPKPDLMNVPAGGAVIDKNNPGAPPLLNVPARPRPATTPNVGSFEDYVVRRFGAQPTPAQITQARKDYNQSDDKQTPVAETVPLTPEGLDAAAMMFAKTGQLPPMGMGSAAAAQRAKIINRAAVLMPGLDLASAKADFGANQASLRALQQQRDAVGAFEETAIKNLAVFLDAAAKIPDTGSPLLNRPLRALNERVLGSPEQAAVNAARRTVIPEFAKILANPGLSGQLSDSARHEVEEVASGNATLKQMIAVAKVLKTDAANRRQSYDDQLTAIRARISKAQTPASSAAPAEGETKPIPGFPGTEQTFQNGKWIRTK